MFLAGIMLNVVVFMETILELKDLRSIAGIMLDFVVFVKTISELRDFLSVAFIRPSLKGGLCIIV